MSKNMGLLRKFQAVLLRSSLITSFKTFIKSQLVYTDIIYEPGYNSSFHEKLVSIQYNARLARTGAIRSSSAEKLYQKLGLESLK